MDFDKKEKEFDWAAEEQRLKKAFDFEAFLEADELDDRITDATDGRDLLQPDAFDFAPDYIPRRPGEGERGRHEAPGQDIDFQEETPPQEEKPALDTTDPRYAAPERPRVLVAERRPTVYVTPEGDFQREGDTAVEPSPSGGGEGKSWLIAIVITLGIVAAVLAVVLGLLGGRDEPEGEETRPAPTMAAEESTPAPAPTQAPDVTPAPTDEPEPSPKPTEPPAVTYTITVTAGTGGSISPSGAITVEEGDDITFSVTPDSGYVLRELMVDGRSVSPEYNYTFSRVQEDHTIYAVFEILATATPAPTPEPTAEPTPAPTPEPTAEPTPAPAEPPASATDISE